MNCKKWLFLLIVIILVLIIYILYTHLEKYSDIFIKKCLYISKSNKGGFGVFTSQFIPIGTVIEISHTIPLTVNERNSSKILSLYDYNIDQDNTCIALGYGSIYNNCKYHNNVVYKYKDGKMIYKTDKNIYPHCELYVDYGKHYFKENNIKEL
jgi:hypothetical protein